MKFLAPAGQLCIRTPLMEKKLFQMRFILTFEVIVQPLVCRNICNCTIFPFLEQCEPPSPLYITLYGYAEHEMNNIQKQNLNCTMCLNLLCNTQRSASYCWRFFQNLDPISLFRYAKVNKNWGEEGYHNVWTTGTTGQLNSIQFN